MIAFRFVSRGTGPEIRRDKKASLRLIDDVALGAELVIGGNHGCFGNLETLTKPSDGGKARVLFQTAVFNGLADGLINLTVHRNRRVFVRRDKII